MTNKPETTGSDEQVRPPATGTTTDVTEEPRGGRRGKGAGKRGSHPAGRTKLGAAWVSLVVTAIVLILLVIFFLQNARSVPIHYLGASGHFPLAVALVLTAIGGVILGALPAGARVLQLRHTIKKQSRHHVE